MKLHSKYRKWMRVEQAMEETGDSENFSNSRNSVKGHSEKKSNRKKRKERCILVVV